MYICSAYSPTLCCWTVDKTVHCQIYHVHIGTDERFPTTSKLSFHGFNIITVLWQIWVLFLQMLLTQIPWAPKWSDLKPPQPENRIMTICLMKTLGMTYCQNEATTCGTQSNYLRVVRHCDIYDPTYRPFYSVIVHC